VWSGIVVQWRRLAARNAGLEQTSTSIPHASYRGVTHSGGLSC
jgi:hypothetical protein